MHTKVLIIGSGPAGYTAAIYAARANLAPIQILGLQPGGQLMITTDVENYPGFAAPIQGPWLMEQMEAQARHVGAALINDMITSVDLSQRPFRATGDSGATYSGDTLIIATGAQARWLGLPSEEHFRGYGVSACATCDGFFYRGKEVAIVGGGNTAVEEALFLTNFASRVTLIHRRDQLRAERIMQDRLFANPKIRVIWRHEIAEIVGHEESGHRTVTGARLRDVDTGAEQTIGVDGVFVAIGHDPATALFTGQIDMDGENYILTAPDSTQTSVPGVFAAGDVKDKVFRQAITAAGMGCMAALEADRFLAEHSRDGVAADFGEAEAQQAVSQEAAAQEAAE
jgi:thioredoxin reductase (NADPH)